MTDNARAYQPLLHDAVAVINAPVQCWSRVSGDFHDPIDGIYLGDMRHVNGLHLTIGERPIEWVDSKLEGANELRCTGLVRGFDGPGADPTLVVSRRRGATSTGVEETITITSHLPIPCEPSIELNISSDATPMAEVKSGYVQQRHPQIEVSEETATVEAGAASSQFHFPGAELSPTDAGITASWRGQVPAWGQWEVAWGVELDDESMVVRAPTTAWGPPPEVSVESQDIHQWLQQAWADLGALRLRLPGSQDEFFAAGAPWFFTLFGRDSLWTARFVLPWKPELAMSTLRALASLQGEKTDLESAEQPGKILHELRAQSLELPDEKVTLPPQYYGSVDATLLWIMVLHDAWKSGVSPEEILGLCQPLQSALNWMMSYGDGDGDGFLDYIDVSGSGLANQGWKDSGDAIQWRDGQLATPPIALVEVQGYAYEAALSGAAVLEWAHNQGYDLGGGPMPGELREWAKGLRQRFRESYWVETEEGYYPAIALDGNKNPVDTLTSNIGHLLGTGILDPEEEQRVAQALTQPSMLSPYGIRTLSTQAQGFWPLSYHGGSVWSHDTAIALFGMYRAGLHCHARQVREALVGAARHFNFRVPELHAGDEVDKALRGAAGALPYPAACRPQAWSAAAAMVCWKSLVEENRSQRTGA